MTFFSMLSADDTSRYFRIITQAVGVQRHFDLLVWLQGDVQAHIPHDILVAAWGDFEKGALFHDVVSDLQGVRSENIDAKSIAPFLKTLFRQWVDYGRRPFVISANETGWFRDDVDLQRQLGDGLQRARSMLVHGIHDERGGHDCIYVMLSTKMRYRDAICSAMEILLPYIDTALRRVAHLPHQHAGGDPEKTLSTTGNGAFVELWNLSPREVEIMHWVAMGKTNFEIGSILNISAFTVKNHMQRIFKKLDVSNRMQAVTAFNLAHVNE